MARRAQGSSFRIDLCLIDPSQCNDKVDAVKLGRPSYIGWTMSSEARTLTKIEPKAGKNQERLSLDEGSQYIAPENMQATIRGFEL